LQKINSKLTGTQIHASFAGMALTDEVHWNDFYQPNGVIVSTEMGRKTTGKWRVQKDQLCLDRGRELGSGCYEVWLSGKNVQLKAMDRVCRSKAFLRGRRTGTDSILLIRRTVITITLCKHGGQNDTTNLDADDGGGLDDCRQRFRVQR
jgi:hypothetical protein